MPVSYHHTQIGYMIIASIGAAILVLGTIIAAAGNTTVLPLLILLFLTLAIFSTLTTTVENGALEVRFGLGVIRRRIHLSDIREVRVVRNPWYCGWGIRWIGRGWLWNVSGFGAVELELRSGRRFRVGSDEPERLAQALQGS